jgi:hydroxymethylpyrimidine pyrophosphatase-like HAD family hydrolase
MKDRAIILDIDGTLLNEIGHCEFLKIISVDFARKDILVFVCTGRPEYKHDETIDMLEKHGIYFDILKMSKKEDSEIKNSEIKEKFLNDILKTCDVIFAFDDHPSTIGMYRRYGIPCAKVFLK